jgi:hypothetical protein
MATPTTWNVIESGWANKIFGLGQTASLLIAGDSLISGEPSTSGQGWDNEWYGILRTWAPSRWRGISYELQRNTGNYNPTPDIFTVLHVTTGTFQKPPSDPWLPDSAAGILPNSGYSWLGVNGLLQNYYQCSADPNAVSASLAACLMDTLTVRVVGYRHADGPDAIQMQSQREAQSLSAVVLDLSGTAGLVTYEISGGIQSTADITKKAIVVLRQRVADGDLSAKYTRIADVLVYRSGVGLYADSIGIGSSDSANWGLAYDGVGAGYFTDAALQAYMAAAMNTDCVMFQIGQNDISGFDRATFKTNVRAFADRAHAAMLANGIATPRICLVGTYWSQAAGNSFETVEAINEVMLEVCKDGIALGRAWCFIGLLALMNNQRISADHLLLGQDVHPNQSGADYIAGLLQQGANGSMGYTASAARTPRWDRAFRGRW